MKKFWKVIAAIGLSAALCVPLAACGEARRTPEFQKGAQLYRSGRRVLDF